MGVDDEYRAVSADETSEHLLEKSAPITRAAYKKRSLFASVAIGALIGAAIMFAMSVLFTPNKSVAPATTTVTSVVTTTAIAPAALETGSNKLNPDLASGNSNKNANNKAADEKKDEIKDCGGNAEEARAKGCVFDVMMQLWMQPDCYDSTLSEKYLLAGNWTWWADADAAHTLTLDEMRKGEHPVIYVIQDYHKQHCIFAWEKLVRALRNERPVIEELISYDHVMHCKMRTLSRGDDNVRGVRAPTGYSRCAKYDTWTRHLPSNEISSTD